jgi:hypothetical protein
VRRDLIHIRRPGIAGRFPVIAFGPVLAHRQPKVVVRVGEVIKLSTMNVPYENA